MELSLGATVPHDAAHPKTESTAPVDLPPPSRGARLSSPRVDPTTGLQRDLVRELYIYNTDRAHQRRRTKGLTPEQALTERNPWL
jgi:hypothetical protein